LRDPTRITSQSKLSQAASNIYCRRMMPTQRCLVLIALLALLTRHAASQTPSNPPSHPADVSAAVGRDKSLSVMRNMIEQYSTDFGALERYHNAPASEKRTERFSEFFGAKMRQLASTDFTALDQDGRVDYLLLKSRLQFELRELEHEQRRLQEIAEFIPFAKSIVELEDARRRMEPIDSANAAKVLTSISDEVGRARKQIERRLKVESESLALTKAIGHRAARTVDDFRQTLKRWHEFYAGYHPEFTWWASQSAQKVDKDLQDYAAFIRKRLVETRPAVATAEQVDVRGGRANRSETETSAPGGEDEPIVGDPIGREALNHALALEMIPYTPEQLIQIANKEFAWCEAEYRRAAKDLGFGDDWRKALDYVSNAYVKPGEQPQLIKRLADEAIDFVEKNDLVTVPDLCKEIWRMEMMTPERQKVNPFFTGGEVVSVSFPTSTMSYEDKLMGMRGNNIHFSRAVVHHELIPGHHLQGFMSARFNAHRRLFRTAFLVEGWALYWEMRLWDLGFPKSAEDRIGMLFWRSHRCARIIFSLNFHLGKMTPQECIDFLVERVGHERRNATGEVRRSFAGAYGPLYQAAYMLGGLQIRSLHDEVVRAGKMTERQFHDAILRENAIPIEMIRASLTKVPLTPDYAPSWRFYPIEN
jgi:uncharacterized protein (DUF885 family)